MTYKEIMDKIDEMEYEEEGGEEVFHQDLRALLASRYFNAKQIAHIFATVVDSKHCWDYIDILDAVNDAVELIEQFIYLIEDEIWDEP